MKKLLFVFICCYSLSSYAGVLVTGATIGRVSNTASNQDIFYIIVVGGTGPCANSKIRFPLSEAGSEKIYDRAFSMALTAYASGSKIEVVDYDDPVDCYGAESIHVYK